MPIPKLKLIRAIRSLFNEDEEITKMMVEVLLTGKLRIGFDEILSMARKLEAGKSAEALSRETVLAMEDWKLMLPERTKHGRGIAWENRLNLPRTGESYEVPLCITLAFNNLRSQGLWNWRFSVEEYMKTIREPHKDIALDVVGEVLAKSYFKRFTNATVVKEACKHHNYPGDIGALIAKLKGGGIISPCLSHSLFRKDISVKDKKEFYGGAPLYELNKALFVLELSGAQ